MHSVKKVFDAMKAGAVDFVAKPQVTEREQLRNFLCSELPVKIKVASTARVSRYKSRSLLQQISTYQSGQILI